MQQCSDCRCFRGLLGWANLTGFKFTEVANKVNKFLQAPPPPRMTVVCSLLFSSCNCPKCCSQGPDTEADVCAELQQAVAAGDHVKVRIVNYTKDGEPFHNVLECFPLRDPAGKLTHYCGVLEGESVKDGKYAKYARDPAQCHIRTK